LIDAFDEKTVLEIVVSPDSLVLLLVACIGPVLMGVMQVWWNSLGRDRSPA